ncbi:2-oxo acid dehydrogenase subunit E2, partial [Escherichia coli]|nr:2-oxo acid dehydrogenase subunit E2 [Escherichia coli]
AEPAKPVKAEEPKPQPAKAEPKPEIKVEKPAAPVVHAPVSAPVTVGAPRAEGDKPLAPPAVRLRAREAGVDLRQVTGTGPAGRITHEDLDT